jgi:ATP-dependent RNA helicase RhlE
LKIEKFADLQLSDRLLRAIMDAGYTVPTPIQARAIPTILERADLLGIAQTGTGKTAAFTLPLLHNLVGDGGRSRRNPAALVLAPTRELALQISENLIAYGRYLNIRHTVIMGGANQNKQVNALRRGVDIVIATPGRLMDLIRQGQADLSECRYLVLDEADRMLDMGFIHDVRRIAAALPKERQTLLFSATMPAEIEKLAGAILRHPKRIEVSAPRLAVERIDQRVVHCDTAQKRDLLNRMLASPEFSRVIVFARTKRGADKVSRNLEADGISAAALHGNKSQNARQRALKQFNDGTARVLVATDIASRGIDVPSVSHVINYELPDVPESYVHRIGRTARAGAAGTAISFCDTRDRENLRGIERFIRHAVPLMVEPTRFDGKIAETGKRHASESTPMRRRPRRRRQTRRLAA